MDAFTVLRPGLLTTIQDLGRFGLQRYGVPTSGAMDALSLRLGNLLLDNPEGSAALEMTIAGPTLRALGALTCACTGTDMGLRVNGGRVSTGRTFAVGEGDVLRFGTAKAGARAYLCVKSGFDAPRTLGSRSVDTASRIGGSPIARGNVLYASASGHAFAGHRRLKPRFRRKYTGHYALRVLRGPQADSMPEQLERLQSCTWRVSASSNRIGARLEGDRLAYGSTPFETEGIPPGAIQITPDGAPIILLADRQTTGGYPKPAVVASVDIPLAGQLRPGDTVDFRTISEEEALALLRQQEKRIRDGVYEAIAPAIPDELLRLLEGSDIEEFALRSEKASLVWKRRGS